MVGVTALYSLRCVCGWQDLTDVEDGLVRRASLHEAINPYRHFVDTVQVR